MARTSFVLHKNSLEPKSANWIKRHLLTTILFSRGRQGEEAAPQDPLVTQEHSLQVTKIIFFVHSSNYFPKLPGNRSDLITSICAGREFITDKPRNDSSIIVLTNQMLICVEITSWTKPTVFRNSSPLDVQLPSVLCHSSSFWPNFGSAAATLRYI